MFSLPYVEVTDHKLAILEWAFPELVEEWDTLEFRDQQAFEIAAEEGYERWLEDGAGRADDGFDAWERSMGLY